MKIYLFHPETGAYLGEDFADEHMAEGQTGRFPADATKVAPPAVEPGMIPVFCRADRCWTVRSLADLRGVQCGGEEK